MNSPHRRKRHDDVYRAIVELTNELGYSPSIREIMVRIGVVSTSTVWNHLRTLQLEGRITRDPAKVRSITVTEVA